jgi:hypothetical protein
MERGKTFIFWNLKGFISSSLEISKRACAVTDSNSELRTADDVAGGGSEKSLT